MVSAPVVVAPFTRAMLDSERLSDTHTANCDGRKVSVVGMSNFAPRRSSPARLRRHVLSFTHGHFISRSSEGHNADFNFSSSAKFRFWEERAGN